MFDRKIIIFKRLIIWRTGWFITWISILKKQNILTGGGFYDKLRAEVGYQNGPTRIASFSLPEPSLPPILGVVLVKLSLNAKNQPVLSINVVRNPFTGF